MTSPGDWERVRDLFHAALDVPPNQRQVFIEQRAGDPRVLAEVTSLLAAYPAAEGFLSGPADLDEVAEPADAGVRLRPGDRLGAFELRGLLGAGGMGEVHRARDTRLGRDVAIKVLSSDRGTGPAGRAQIEREARAIAALTHPRICMLHDVGTGVVGGAEVTYLVMELVEGESLAARLARGSLPLSQALAVAIDVAEALVAAHAAGIVHRDLKPANVMLARSGAKLLDFGLARLRKPWTTEAAPGGVPAGPSSNESALIGTPGYMAPEQLKGATVDARSDLFAFGAMLYEMISGRRAFDGGSQTELVAAILNHDPAPPAPPAGSVPQTVQRLVATCLAKDPDERWQTAKDLLRELRWVRDECIARELAASDARRAPRRRVLMTTGLMLAAALASVGVVVAIFRPPAPSRISFTIAAPDGTRFLRGASDMAVSPDGTRLVFVALSRDGRRKLWVRRFDAVESKPIDGSEDAHGPFWSPDGRSVAFWTDNALVRMPETGGVPQKICDAPGGWGGSWNRNGTILFGGYGQPIMQVADTGGVPAAITAVDGSRHEVGHARPIFLADGRRFLFHALNDAPGAIAIHQGTLGSPVTRRVLAVDNGVALAGQHLVTLSRGILTARPYDADRAQVGAAALTIAEGLVYDSPQRSGPAFAASGGVVAFRSANPDSRLVWFDRDGRELGAFSGRADYHHPWLSPDEQRVAAEKTDPATGLHTIWILDGVRGTTSRLLSAPDGAHNPVWSPDGRRLVYVTNRKDTFDLYEIAAEGGHSGTLVHTTEGWLNATDWSLDGRYLMFEANRRGRADLVVLPMSPKATPQPFVETGAEERQGHFSPDAQWAAYTSNESGAPEVYVRRFPPTERKWQISVAGGAQPRWRRDGRELLYLAPDGKLMAVDVRAGRGGLEIGQPHALFSTGIVGSFMERRNHFVVARDGKRVLVNLSADEENPAPITVVMNWDASVPR